ncbi:hypothetical protein DLJ49_06740 [Rhodovulum sp. 12E13]|uniref:hypothetical protein n=1 Tax=Rhodovulum sp. 12E13 TaxID=2203891 RepID=UPI000E148784|nr:hypothetical protein [Rhodovulum sp. 12E13]RDC73802.1 hypothetical protein DLJ49_06740 [Rhodovulum sp. 12E13]
MRALALAVAVALAPAAQAQQDASVARPNLLAAMGLLDSEEATVRHPRAPDFAISVPSSDEVTAERLDVPQNEDDVVAAWEFRTGEGAVVETLTLTVARIDPAEPVVRQFAMANLLVLRSYAEIARQFPGARLIAFGPVAREDGLSAVQTVGNFETGEGRALVFRHVGLMAEGREQALVAIVNIDPERMPVRSDSELVDTFAGRALGSLRLVEDGGDLPAD